MRAGHDFSGYDFFPTVEGRKKAVRRATVHPRKRRDVFSAKCAIRQISGLNIPGLNVDLGSLVFALLVVIIPLVAGYAIAWMWLQ